MSLSKAAFLWGIRQQESGGNYKSTNPSGATGAYQVMAYNIAEWTKKVLGRSVSRDEFLKSPAIQDAVADAILGGYFQKYGPEGAAAMWYSGQPDPSKTYGDPPVYQYVQEVMGHARQAPAGISLPLSGSAAAGAAVDTGTGAAAGAGAVKGSSDGGLFDWPGDIIDFFRSTTTAVTSSAEFFSAFFKPSTYVRVGAGIAGIVLLMLGILTLGMSAVKEK